MILYRKHTFKAEINYAYREINTWLKSLGFIETFKQQQNHFTEYHWYKDGSNIILKFEHPNENHFTKYVYLFAQIINHEYPFVLKSNNFKYDDYDKILSCHQQFVNSGYKLRRTQ